MRKESQRHAVLVDGVEKGEAFVAHGRWHWRRPSGATEPFRHGSRLEDVLDWARRCCRGEKAESRRCAP